MAGHWRDQQRIGIIAAVSAVALGVIYMFLAGAPPRLMLMNAAALGIGLALLVLARKLRTTVGSLRGPLLVGLALCVAATAFFGLRVEGAARWASLFGLTIQPSLMIVPLLVTGYAARPDRWAAASLVIVAGAVAVQPDRAAAAMVLAGVGATALLQRDRTSVVLALVAAAGLGATLLQPDTLPAVPFVDQILYTAGEAHILAGLAVWLGTLALFLPGLACIERCSSPVVAFLMVWAAGVIAALLHNYPTPLIGYGASPIIGYLLSLLALPNKRRAGAGSGLTSGSDGVEETDHQLKFA